MDFKKKSKFWAYFFAIIFSAAILLRYVDFFHLDSQGIHFEKDQIELDISNEKFLESNLELNTFYSSEYDTKNAHLIDFGRLAFQKAHLNSLIIHRLKLYEKQKFLSNPLANLPQVYVSSREKVDRKIVG